MNENYIHLFLIQQQLHLNELTIYELHVYTSYMFNKHCLYKLHVHGLNQCICNKKKLNLVTSRAFRAHESRVTKSDHRAQCTEGKNKSYRLSSFSNSCSKETKFIATIFFREEIIPSFDFFCKFIHFSGP